MAEFSETRRKLERHLARLERQQDGQEGKKLPKMPQKDNEKGIDSDLFLSWDSTECVTNFLTFLNLPPFLYLNYIAEP